MVGMGSLMWRRVRNLQVRKIKGLWWVLFPDQRPVMHWDTFDRAIDSAHRLSSSIRWAG